MDKKVRDKFLEEQELAKKKKNSSMNRRVGSECDASMKVIGE